MKHHLLAAVVALVFLAACSRDPKKSGPAVAKGQDVLVTADEFKAKLDEQSPFVRARYTTLDRKKEFLENLLRFELLAAEARRLELDKDPEVQATVKKILVQRLVRKAFEDDAGKSAGEADVRRYYDEHVEEFVQPERVRVSQIYLRADRSPAERAARAGDAKKLLARLKAESAKNPLAFANAARELSDDLASRPSGGDLGFRTLEDLEKAWTRPVATATQALRNVGDESGLIETERGFHLLRLTGRQAPTNRPFEQVKGQLASRIGRDKHSKDFEEFVKGLREKAKIEVIDAELEKVQVSAAPTTALPGTQPAMAPPPPGVPGAPPAPGDHR